MTAVRCAEQSPGASIDDAYEYKFYLDIDWLLIACILAQLRNPFQL
jgi:hypothetical protein